MNANKCKSSYVSFSSSSLSLIIWKKFALNFSEHSFDIKNIFFNFNSHWRALVGYKCASNVNIFRTFRKQSIKIRYDITILSDANGLLCFCLCYLTGLFLRNEKQLFLCQWIWKMNWVWAKMLPALANRVSKFKLQFEMWRLTLFR